MGGKKIKKAYALNLTNLNNKLLFFFLLCFSLFLLLLRFFSSHLLLNNSTTTPDQDPTNCLQHQLQDEHQDPADHDQILLIYNPPIQSTPPPPPPKPQLMLLADEVLQLRLRERGNSKIGLVNFSEREREAWEELGTDEISLISFDPVKDEVRWEDLFPEWINEERWPLPRCPEIPMPAAFEEYGELDMVVAKVPCESTEKTNKKGVRDVMRLQVNLVVANLIVKNGRRRKDHDDDGGGGRPVYAVFVGSCEPMWEIFRCDDLLRHEGDFWVYKPDLNRLKGVVETPVGTCRLAIPYVKQGDGRIRYLFSKLGNSIDHPREAYVTILHSSEAYVCGAIALAQSIILTKSTKDLVLLADKSITKTSKRALIAAGWKIKHIERIQSPFAEKDAYNEWNYSKLRMWQLTDQYDKIIFIDSDLIVIKNMDSFFANSQLSAVGNDNMLFNSGVMLIEPSQCMFDKLMQKRFTLVSYNGGDQGFLNEAFTWWHRWPKTLNYLKIFDQENETERRIPESVYAIHYLGLKPWTCYRDYDCNWDVLDHHLYASDLAHKRWWQVYDAMPKRLRGFCGLSRFMDSSLRMQRAWAKKAKLPDGHWKIKVKDPRRHQRSMIL